MLVGAFGDSVGAGVERDWKDVALESVGSPSRQSSPSGVLLAPHFSQVAQELRTRHYRGGRLVQCFHLLCHDVLRSFRYGFVVIV